MLANPVVSTTACNCTSNPALAETSLGLTDTLVTAGVSVVNTTAPLKGEVDKTLAPTSRILNWWKNELTEEERLTPKKQAIYKALYIRDVLAKLDVKEYAKKYQNKVLLCFEKTGDFCHRHIVAEWFNNNGFECKEL